MIRYYFVIFSLFLSTILLANAFGFEEQSFMLRGGGFANSLVIHPNKNLVFVGDSDYNGITIIDTHSGKTNFVDLGKMNNDSGNALVEIVFNEKANEIYATSDNSRFVSVIDASNYSIVNQIDLGEFNSGYSLIVNENTNTVYVVSDNSYFLTVIAGNREIITDRIDIGSPYDPSTLSAWVPAEISVNSSTNQIFVSNLFAKTVSVIDGNSNKIIKTISLEDYPTAVEPNEKTNELFIIGSDSISKFDGNDWKLIYNKKGVGANYNKNVSIDPQTNLIYLTDPYRPLTVVDGNTGDLVSVIDVIYPNHFVEVDPVTKKVYLGTEGSIEILDKITIEPKPKKHFEPPLKQAKDGIDVANIKCNEGFVMVLKKSTTLPACVKPETKTKLIERGWAKSTLDVLPANTLTGNLTVYILPYPTNEDYLGNIQKVSETIKSLGEINFIPFGEFGASKLGQYDNDEKIWKPSESVKFAIHHDVKESNGKTVTVDDISENMLFGNAIAFGGVGLKDGSAPAATIIVVDSSFESIMNPIIDELTSLLTGQKTWVEIDPIQCGGNPWEKDWLESHPDDFSIYARLITNEKIELIKNYYKKQDIEIFDVKSFPWEDVAVCEACSCPAGYTLYLLVSNYDVQKMQEFGYKISENIR